MALTEERRAVLESRLARYEQTEEDMVRGTLTSSFSHGDSGSNRSESFASTADLQEIRAKISMVRRELGMTDPFQLHPMVPDNYCRGRNH